MFWTPQEIRNYRRLIGIGVVLSLVLAFGLGAWIF